MASSEGARCGNCHTEFDENTHIPKLLCCDHTLCQQCASECFEPVLTIGSLGVFKLDCPFCHESTEVEMESSDGPSSSPVSRLPTNLEVELPEICSPHNNPFIKYCKLHNKSLCVECVNCTCVKCELVELIQYKDELGKKNVLLKDVLEKKKKLKDKQSEQTDVVELSKEAALKKVDDQFDEFIRTMTEELNARKEEVKSEIRKVFKEKDAHLQREIRDLEDEVSGLEKSQDVIDGVLKRGKSQRNTAYINRDKHMIHQLKKAKETEKTIQNPRNFIKFELGNAVPKIKTAIKELGVISDDKAPPMPKVYDFRAENTAVGLASWISFVLSTNFYDIEQINIDSQFAGPDDEQVTALVTRTKAISSALRVDVYFKPYKSGRHKCTIKVLGTVLDDGEQLFDVQTNDPVVTIGPAFGPDHKIKLHCPRYATLDQAGNLKVVDQSQVYTFEQDGMMLLHKSFKFNHEKGDKYWSGSSCIALDHKNNKIYAPLVSQKGWATTSAWANAVIVYDMATLSVSSVLENKSSPMKTAMRVVLNSEGKVVVSDAESHCLIVFNNQGEVEKIIGHEGSGPGEFKYPTYVAIGQDDDVIVSDTRNHRIQILNKSGEFKLEFGSKGSGVNNLNMPAGVAVDNHNHILVSDHGNKRIQIFEYNGSYVSSVKVEKAKWLCGLVTTKDGHVFATDKQKNCVFKFQYWNDLESKLSVKEEK